MVRDWFIWTKEEYSVSVDEMDREHQELIALMNRLHKRADEGALSDELENIMLELGKATQRHFHDEEEIMKKMNFPGFESHHLIHKNLLEKYIEFVGEFRKGDGKVSPDFFRFLKIWLQSHMAGMDRKYGEHSKKVKKAA